MAPDFNDPYAPDLKSTRRVCCLHCDREYEEREIQWRKLGHDWYWCCKHEDCDGVGLGYDIHPASEPIVAHRQRA